MTTVLHKKRRKDFIPYFLGLVLFLYCTVHLVSFTAKSAQETHPVRVRRALGKIMKSDLIVFMLLRVYDFYIFSNVAVRVGVFSFF